MIHKIHKSSLLTVFIIFILPIFIYWMWFFNFNILTNGDWGFFFAESQKDLLAPAYVWITGSFGSVFLTASSYPSFLLTGLLHYLNNFSWTERLIYLWPAVILSSISSYVLAKKILNNNIAAIIGSLVYCYNTYLLSENTGQLTLSVAFAAAPLIIYFFIKTLEEKKLYQVILTSLAAGVSATYDFRVFYIIAFILLFYFIYYSFCIDQVTIKNILRNALFAFLPILLVVLLNTYWLLGLGLTGSLTHNAIFDRTLFGNGYMNILESLTLFHPFWTGTEIEAFVIQPIPLYFFLIPICAILGLALNRKNKNVVFFGFIAILGIFLAKQAGEPFPESYAWLYKNFPGFNAFRESSKFYFLVALSYSILISAFVDWLWVNWQKNSWQIWGRYILIFLIAGLFLWNTKPIITTEIGTLFVSRSIPNDYLIYKKFILQQPGYFRTMWTPEVPRWAIYTNEKPKIGNVDVIQQDWQGFIDGKYHDYWPIRDQIIDIYKIIFSNQLLDVSSIKYIAVPIQDFYNDDDFYQYFGKDRQFYIKELNKLTYLHKIDIGTKDLIVYENKNYRPHLYLTNELETIYKNLSFTTIDWQFKNPTEYTVRLTDISHPVFLNFSEAYHPDWKIRVGNFNWWAVLWDKDYFIPNNDHVQNDATLNSFYLDPEQICVSNKCEKNSDGSYNIELTLYFQPQSYFYLGLIISGATLLGCFGYLGYAFVQRRKRRTEKAIEKREIKGKL